MITVAQILNRIKMFEEESVVLQSNDKKIKELKQLRKQIKKDQKLRIRFTKLIIRTDCA